MKHFIHNTRAVSPVVSALFALIIVISGASSLFLYAVPILEKAKMENAVEDMYTQFSVLTDYMTGVVRQNLTSSQQPFTLSIPQGSLSMDPKGDRLIVLFSLPYLVGLPPPVRINFFVTGFDDDDERFNVQFFRPPPPIPTDVRATVYWQEDPIGEQAFDGVKGPPNRFRFTCNRALTNSIKIKLEDTTNPLAPKIFGYIYLFDLGNLEYTCSSPAGNPKEVIENNAILLNNTPNEMIRYDPLIFSKMANGKITTLSMRVIQMRGSGFGSSSGIFRMALESKQHTNLEILTKVYYLKIQIYGPYWGQWRTYFEKTHSFSRDLASDLSGHTLNNILLESPCNFFLIRSLFTAD